MKFTLTVTNNKKTELGFLMEIQPIRIMLKNSKKYLINLGRNFRIPDSDIYSFHVFFFLLHKL